MKDADFQNLLQGVREAGAYLRNMKGTMARVDSLAGSLGKGRPAVSLRKMNQGAKAAIARSAAGG